MEIQEVIHPLLIHPDLTWVIVVVEGVLDILLLQVNLADLEEVAQLPEVLEDLQ
jgi:hypothetical protein